MKCVAPGYSVFVAEALGLPAGLCSSPQGQEHAGVAVVYSIPALVVVDDWPSGSTDSNPLICKFWSVLEDKLRARPQKNLVAPKYSSTKAAAEMTLETVHVTVAECLALLRACVKAKRSHFQSTPV